MCCTMCTIHAPLRIVVVMVVCCSTVHTKHTNNNHSFLFVRTSGGDDRRLPSLLSPRCVWQTGWADLTHDVSPTTRTALSLLVNSHTLVFTYTHTLHVRTQRYNTPYNASPDRTGSSCVWVSSRASVSVCEQKRECGNK